MMKKLARRFPLADLPNAVQTVRIGGVLVGLDVSGGDLLAKFSARTSRAAAFVSRLARSSRGQRSKLAQPQPIDGVIGILA